MRPRVYAVCKKCGGGGKQVLLSEQPYTTKQGAARVRGTCRAGHSISTADIQARSNAGAAEGDASGASGN